VKKEIKKKIVLVYIPKKKKNSWATFVLVLLRNQIFNDLLSLDNYILTINILLFFFVFTRFDPRIDEIKFSVCEVLMQE
jgi:hypothetical protein